MEGHLTSANSSITGNVSVSIPAPPDDIQAHLRRRSNLQQTISSIIADLQQSLIRLSSSSAAWRNSHTELNALKELENLKKSFESNVKLIKSQMNNVMVDTYIEAPNFFKGLALKLVVKIMIFETEKARVALKKKEDAMTLIFIRLKKLHEKQNVNFVIARQAQLLGQGLLVHIQEYLDNRAICRNIVNLVMEMRDQLLKINEIVSDYEELMKKILPDDKDAGNGILKCYRMVEFSWVIKAIFTGTFIALLRYSFRLQRAG